MHPDTTPPCACGHDLRGHYRGRGVCLKTSCPCQALRPVALPRPAGPDPQPAAASSRG